MSASRRSAILVSLATLALLSFAHVYVHAGYLARLDGPYPAGAPRAARVAPPREGVRRLRVVLLDGLGWDASRAVPEIVALPGASRPLLADFPSFTYPALRTLATGRPPVWSGVRINADGPYPPFDSVAREAAAAGVRVRVAGGDLAEFAELLALPAAAVTTSADAIFSDARDARSLDWIYFGEVDEEGHRHGAASPEYAAAARRAGAFVARAWAATDPARDALVILSDHGHLAVGGHGGGEPDARLAMLGLAGAGIPQNASFNEGAMRDVGPTLAALLAVPPPKDALGVPMLDVLGLGGEGGSAAARAQDALDAADFARQAWHREAIAVPLLLFLLAALHLLARRAGLVVVLRDALPTLAYAGLFAALYRLAGFGVTWSIPHSEALYEAETGLAGIVGAVAAWRVSRRDRHAEETAAFALLFGPVLVLEQAWIGLEHTRIAGPRLSFLYLLLVPAIFYGGLATSLRLLWESWRPRALGLCLGVAAFLTTILAPVAWRFVR